MIFKCAVNYMYSQPHSCFLAYLVQDLYCYWVPQLLDHCSDDVTLSTAFGHGSSNSGGCLLSIRRVGGISLSSCNDLGCLHQKKCDSMT